MEKLLVYPFDEVFQPILQYGSLIQDKLILSLVSPAGWGLVGSEYYTNDGTVLSVSVDFESELEKCDALWIVNSQDMPDGDDEIIKKVEYAISHNKDVYFTRNKSESLEYSRFDRSSYSDAVHGFPCECEILFNELRSISTPVLLISDLYGGMNSLWLELSIRRNLIKEGYRVLSISCDKTASLIGCITYPDKLFTGDLDTKEKILMINNYLIQKEALYTPDIIVASIPNGLMNCSPRCLDQFGYYMFLISKSVSPDLCVLRLPFNNYSKMELDHLLEYISNTFGVTTDFLYFANKYLLLEDSEIYGYPRYLNLSKDFVSENKTEKEEQGIFYYTEEESLTKEIIKKLSSYGNDTYSVRRNYQYADVNPNCDTEEKLIAIFLKRTGVDFSTDAGLKEVNFLGTQLNIPVRELVLVYLDIEYVFNTSIPKEFIVEGRFTTFQNILSLLK